MQINEEVQAVLVKDMELNGASAKAGACGWAFREGDGTLVFQTFNYHHEDLVLVDGRPSEPAEFVVVESDLSLVNWIKGG